MYVVIEVPILEMASSKIVEFDKEKYQEDKPYSLNDKPISIYKEGDNLVFIFIATNKETGGLAVW